jgi:hypothetical protein
MAESVSTTLPLRRDTVRAYIAQAAPVETVDPAPSWLPARSGGATPLPLAPPSDASSLLERTSRATEERPRPMTGGISTGGRETRETFMMSLPVSAPLAVARASAEGGVWSAPVPARASAHRLSASRVRWRPRPVQTAALLPAVFAAGTGAALRAAGQDWEAATIGASASLVMSACTFAAGAISARRGATSATRALTPTAAAVPETKADTASAPPSPLRRLRTRRPSKPAERPVARWTEEHGEPDPAISARTQGRTVGTLQVVEAAPAGLTLTPAEDGAGWRWQWGPCESAEVQCLPLANGGVYTIGAGERCDVRLPATEGAAVSHDHARITIRRGRVLFHHIGDQGESRINGERAVWAVLEPGDTIGIGPYRCRLLAPEDENAAS